MKTEKIEVLLNLLADHGYEQHTWYPMPQDIEEACAELAALKSTAEDLECLLGEAQVEKKKLWKAIHKAQREAMEKCLAKIEELEGLYGKNLGCCDVSGAIRTLIEQLGKEK